MTPVDSVPGHTLRGPGPEYECECGLRFRSPLDANGKALEGGAGRVRLAHGKHVAWATGMPMSGITTS